MGRQKKYSPKFDATRDWFIKNKEGYLKDIARKLQCNRTQMRSYCLTLEEEGFVLHELRTQQVRDKKMKVSYYRLTSYVRSEPPLPLSCLSKEEMAANGAYEPHMYVSEARHKKISYGPSIADKQREKALEALHNRLKGKVPELV